MFKDMCKVKLVLEENLHNFCIHGRVTNMPKLDSVCQAEGIRQKHFLKTQ